MVVKAPAYDIESVHGRIPIHIRHELFQHPAAPVIRTVVRMYDQPENPLALETFTNIEDEHQKAEFAALARQRRLLMLFYDEALVHRLTKVVTYGQNQTVPEILRRAESLLASIPGEKSDFERAKAEVMERTNL